MQINRDEESEGCGVNPIHGHAQRLYGKTSPEYHSWLHMRARCLNHRSPAFPRYGGRGIQICERWSSFELFLEDMGPRPADTTLDRIDNNGNYEPGNCRWGSRTQQANNTSRTRFIEFMDERLSVRDWSDRTGLKVATIHTRLRFGWTPERILSEPVHTETRNRRAK